ncbi:hypothetical protein [Pseudomonas sp. PSKL.D1]|uniref:hypothetical protein n=1 Tax=Pseudomonas sp. PSKL.D1 TaxID=3029060 RepID=UPI0023819218|nr:hypothetical protein [Pseudomonas sp. PSKL.D1]WDY58292.1 hypothetical protein PVV54_01265 [Pseudomonas sp. PSKL.D1]
MNIEPALIWMAILGPGCLSMLLLIYVAYKYIDAVEELLANSKYIKDLKVTFSGAGMIGKVVRICIIGGVLLVPGPYARRGLVDLTEIERFPSGIRRVVVGGLLILVFSFLMMVAFRVWSYLVMQ